MVSMRCLDHSTTYSVHDGIRVGACEECRWVRFGDTPGGNDPWRAMSRLFGDYEMVGRVDTIHAPAGEVLAYRPQLPADTGTLSVIPAHRWFRVTANLWMCHDRALLLLAHGSTHVSRMVGA